MFQQFTLFLTTGATKVSDINIQATMAVGLGFKSINVLIFK
jgi:hypothetical protein